MQKNIFSHLQSSRLSVKQTGTLLPVSRSQTVKINILNLPKFELCTTGFAPPKLLIITSRALHHVFANGLKEHFTLSQSRNHFKFQDFNFHQMPRLMHSSLNYPKILSNKLMVKIDKKKKIILFSIKTHRFRPQKPKRKTK